MQTTSIDFDWYHVHARRLEASDIVLLQGLLMRCIDYFYALNGCFPEPDSAKNMLADAAAAEASGQQILLVGFFSNEDELIGVAVAASKHMREVELDLGLLLIDPAHRKHGMGTAIVGWLKRFARSQSYQRIILLVMSSNQHARWFWQRQGFTESATLAPHLYGQVMQSPLLLACTL